jgi:hypothetical protein
MGCGRTDPNGDAPMIQVAVVTFDGFNELDSFVAAAIINRCR